MGVVYLAEELALGRRVAVKFLRPELAESAGQRDRFLAEARTLARFQHPNIVQVFQTGEVRGRAFLVEEFVAGGGLDRDLARQPRAPKPAAALVATLARAVHYAHGQGVLHRDLKPSNVLLTEGRVPKISDFGLAKRLDDEGASGLTQTGSILGSPAYMAPEQALGRNAEVGPAADIYALGAILYEALTGVPPFLAASPLETLELVRTAEPVPPRRMRPKLPSALETICLKCLAKDPARRYATAEALADDLDRFLAGLPILARPTPRVERLAKWLRRHPGIAVGSAVAVAATVVLIAGAIVYEGRLRAALHRAQGQERRAGARYRAASETLDRMLERLKDRRFARTPQLRDLLRLQLDDVLAFYDRVAQDRDDPDPVVRFDLARARLRSAQIEHQLGRSAEAGANAREALPLLRDLVRDAPDRPDYLASLARCYRTLAMVEPDRGDDVRRAERLLADLVGRFPDRRDFRMELSEARNNLATRAYTARDFSRAEAEYHRAIEAIEPLLDPTPGLRDADVRIALAENHRNLAVMLQGPHSADARAHYDASRLLLGEALSADPDRDEATLALGGTLFNEAIFLAADPATRGEALRRFGEAIDRLTPIVRREPDWTLARSELLGAHGGRAQALEAEGRHADAARDWERVVELAAPGAQRDHHRFFLASAKARAGDHRGAWELVRTLGPSLDRLPLAYAIHLGTVCALAASGAARDETISPDRRAATAAVYAREGAEILRRAVEHQPEADRADLRASFRESPELAPLRSVPEFRSLVGELPVNASAAPAPGGNK